MIPSPEKMKIQWENELSIHLQNLIGDAMSRGFNSVNIPRSYHQEKSKKIAEDSGYKITNNGDPAFGLYTISWD